MMREICATLNAYFQVEDAYKPLESDNELERYIGCSTDGNDLFGVELCAVAKYYYVPGNDLVTMLLNEIMATVNFSCPKIFSIKFG